MTTTDAKKIYKNLLNAGFNVVAGDHKYLEYCCNGRAILQVKAGHGEKNLQPVHLGMMRRQCKLPKKEFIDLIEGRMDAAQYQALLTAAGFISNHDLS